MQDFSTARDPFIADNPHEITERGDYRRMSDVEKIIGGDYAQLTNTNIRSFGWRSVTVSVTDRRTKRPKQLLSEVNGLVKAGELLALMGPSGSGKSTLLNVLAHRTAQMKASIHGDIFINGAAADSSTFRRISAYVEQEDALVGSLTVRETLSFAARLSLPKEVSKNERLQRIEALLASFGLHSQADALIGTPIRKGISGGQKRRVSVAAQLITSPKLLFLDEPTSGLDSAASFEVISFVKDIAKKHNIIVIASIHQPSTSTFAMFDKLLLLSQGRTAFSGPISEVQPYFQNVGFPIPLYMNPAEFIIDFVNTDFARDPGEIEQQLHMVHSSWAKSSLAGATVTELTEEMARGSMESDYMTDFSTHATATPIAIQLALIHRAFIKSYRDIIAYGIRIAMYMGLAIMMGTIWLRLSPIQSNIQSFINAIFFGGAFMSFMAVAYIPAFLEDRALFIKERANGLYGPTSFIVSNFVTGLPYLFVIALLFSIVAYWLSNFRPDGAAFMTWIMWLFLDLIAAESLVVLISSLVPIFVVALAATAFANGLWMCTGGFLVPPNQLNAFWYYVFHFIDYQTYVFQGMMVNEFAERDYECPRNSDGSCGRCSYQSDLAAQCGIRGTAVLDSYGYKTGNTGKWVGILLGIVVGYRLLGWLVLYLRRS